MRILITTRRRMVAVTVGLALLGALTTTAAMATGSGAALRVSAVPGSDATVSAKAFAVAPGTVGSATVACPAGKRVVGGGVGQTGPASSLRFGVVQASGPVDETGQTKNTDSGDVARGWSASVFARTGGIPREYRVYAICSATSDATVEAKALPLADNSNGAASATCQAGTRAIGGGVGQTGVITGAFGTVLQAGPLDETGATKSTESGDTARSWYAEIYNYAGAHEYRVFALCSAGSNATIEAKAVSVGAGRTAQAADAIVQCQPGQRALGGGTIIVAGPDYLTAVQQSGPVDETGQTATTTSGEVARSWSVSVFVADGPVDLRVVAICATDGPVTTTTQARCGGRAATIVGTAAPDVLRGTAGADVIAGLGGNDTISGLGGNDLVCGGSGNDTIAGGAGDDTLAGEAGNDTLNGGPGNDRLSGGPGNDTLNGGPGVDTLNGGPGLNTIKP